MKVLGQPPRPRIKSLHLCKLCNSYFSKRAVHVQAGLQSDDTALQGQVRTRFAPSPTGNLHIGSLRTAVFNYLLAKKYGGQFILRLEDTDRKRVEPGAEDGIYRDLQWAGLSWDEGPEVGGPYGPYRQSDNTNLYRTHADILLRAGRAYRCFCTDSRPGTGDKSIPLNPCLCMDISETESDRLSSKGSLYAIRLKSSDRDPQFSDLVYGNLKISSIRGQGARLGNPQNDLVLLKSDGLPTYHLANVVDDHRMKISHVIRGTEWITSTPKHIALYEAFKWKPPRFAHVSLLLNESGQKFSKRDGNTSIRNIRQNGEIYPAALVNYVALLGWSCQRRNQVMSMAELSENFSLKFSKGDVKVTPEKLHFLNAQHGKRYASQGDDIVVSPIIKRLENTIGSASSQILQGRSFREYVKSVVIADAKNFHNVNEFCHRNSYFFSTYNDCGDIDTSVFRENLDTVNISAIFDTFLDVPESKWNQEDLTFKMYEICEKLVTKLEMEESHDAKAAALRNSKRLIQLYLRAAIARGLHGPGIIQTMALIGRDTCRKRLLNFNAMIRDGSP